ncbi:MAG: hypothetical protein LBB83_05775, partial [Treponema sp.]|nr:hypothetical protein [Treponema sp.]
DDNWIYIAFQTELHDYAFAGALVYEWYQDNAVNKTYSYTEETASPVYDPAIVKPLAARLKERYPSDGPRDAFNPSRPVRVVKYRLSRRPGTEPLSVSVHLTIIPLDVLDRPRTNDDSREIDNDTTLTEGDLFENGDDSTGVDSSSTNRVYSGSSFIRVWYVPKDYRRQGG